MILITFNPPWKEFLSLNFLVERKYQIKESVLHPDTHLGLSTRQMSVTSVGPTWTWLCGVPLREGNLIRDKSVDEHGITVILIVDSLPFRVPDPIPVGPPRTYCQIVSPYPDLPSLPPGRRLSSSSVGPSLGSPYPYPPVLRFSGETRRPNGDHILFYLFDCIL